MRTMTYVLAVFLLAVRPVWAAPVAAVDLLDPKVEYSADFYLRADTGDYSGRVWHAPGKHRREVATAKGLQIYLFRRDADRAYVITPQQKWYVAFGFRSVGDLIGGIDQLLVERSNPRSETIGGIATTRYDTVAQSPQGGRFDGQAWFTKDTIPIKIKGIVRYNGKDMAVETGLLNLKVASQDPGLFELPRDYRGMNMAGVDLQGLAKGLQGLRGALGQ